MQKSNQADADATVMILFAMIMMILLGTFHVISGLLALIEGDFYEPNRYLGDFSITAWGWIHIIVGVLAGLAGCSLFSGAAWARIVVSVVAFVSIIANFVFLPHYPAWSAVMIVLSIGALWAVIAHGGEDLGSHI
jgi:hypothetical protein